MVQEFHVLRCCSCQTYQVQQVKKSKKWNCKLCGEKQSVIKEFGRGSGVDCRRHVQKANARRGEILEEQDQKAWSRWEEVDDVDEEEVVEKAQECCDQNAEEANGSRWSKYLQTSDEGAGQEQAEEENVYMDRNHLQGNINIRLSIGICDSMDYCGPTERGREVEGRMRGGDITVEKRTPCLLHKAGGRKGSRLIRHNTTDPPAHWPLYSGLPNSQLPADHQSQLTANPLL
nr:MRN complex-interacting protein isoform X2 [Salvelinus alpinus]